MKRKWSDHFRNEEYRRLSQSAHSSTFTYTYFNVGVKTCNKTWTIMTQKQVLYTKRTRYYKIDYLKPPYCARLHKINTTKNRQKYTRFLILIKTSFLISLLIRTNFTYNSKFISFSIVISGLRVEEGYPVEISPFRNQIWIVEKSTKRSTVYK